MTCPRSKLSAEAIFSRAGNFVIDVVQTTRPSARNLRMLPSGDAAYTMTIRIGDGRRGRDLIRPGEPVSARRELPEHRAVVRVDRDRLAVGRGDDRHVVRRAVHCTPCEVDRRGVHRSSSSTCWRHRLDVRRVDAGGSVDALERAASHEARPSCVLLALGGCPPGGWVESPLDAAGADSEHDVTPTAAATIAMMALACEPPCVSDAASQDSAGAWQFSRDGNFRARCPGTWRRFSVGSCSSNRGSPVAPGRQTWTAHRGFPSANSSDDLLRALASGFAPATSPRSNSCFARCTRRSAGRRRVRAFARRGRGHRAGSFSDALDHAVGAGVEGVAARLSVRGGAHRAFHHLRHAALVRRRAAESATDSPDRNRTGPAAT